MLLAILSEWVGRSGIRWTFTCRERHGLLAARLAGFLFPGSRRGTLLSVYLDLKDGAVGRASSRMRKYYRASGRVAAWNRRLDGWLSGAGNRGTLAARLLPPLFSLSFSWRRPQPVPCQLQDALWKNGSHLELADLAQGSGQGVLRAHALLAAGLPEMALAELANHAAEKQSGEALFVRAGCLQALGRPQEAVEMLERSVAARGAGAETLNLLVELYRQTDQQEQAARAAERLRRENRSPRLFFKAPDPDRPYHIITEDHELTKSPGKSDPHPWLSIREARIQLIEKGRLVNRIASRCGTPWTHLIDVGSYTILQWAAARYPGSWGEVLAEFEAFLVATVAGGNDLGVHVHPDKSWLAVDRVEADRVWLKRGAPGWGELPQFGPADDLSSKLGLLTAGKTLIERAARETAPGFRAVFFRSGSYALGSTAFEIRESMDAVLRAGLLVGSDALEMDGITESLGRRRNHLYRAVKGAPWAETEGEGPLQALPFQTRESPVYSVLESARRYRSDPKSVGRLERAAQGSGYVIAIDHEIEIGDARHGGRWDDLDPDAADWDALARYLEAVGNSPAFNCMRANDMVSEDGFAADDAPGDD